MLPASLIKSPFTCFPDHQPGICGTSLAPPSGYLFLVYASYHLSGSSALSGLSLTHDSSDSLKASAEGSLADLPLQIQQSALSTY